MEKSYKLTITQEGPKAEKDFIIGNLKGLETLSNRALFLMSPTFYAWKVASPEKTEQERLFSL